MNAGNQPGIFVEKNEGNLEFMNTEWALNNDRGVHSVNKSSFIFSTYV